MPVGELRQKELPPVFDKGFWSGTTKRSRPRFKQVSYGFIAATAVIDGIRSIKQFRQFHQWWYVFYGMLELGFGIGLEAKGALTADIAASMR
jgi:hypothetical protein